MLRFYEGGEIEEIARRFNEGGVMWLIERTDKHQFFYEPRRDHFKIEPDQFMGWSDTIDLKVILTGGFLTKEDAEKSNDFTEGGCRHCGHGSKKIPTIITEHKFESQLKY